MQEASNLHLVLFVCAAMATMIAFHCARLEHCRRDPSCFRFDFFRFFAMLSGWISCVSFAEAVFPGEWADRESTLYWTGFSLSMLFYLLAQWSDLKWQNHPLHKAKHRT